MVKYKTQQYTDYEIDTVPEYNEALHYLENSWCTCKFYLHVHITVHIIRLCLDLISLSPLSPRKENFGGGGEIMYIYL